MGAGFIKEQDLNGQICENIQDIEFGESDSTMCFFLSLSQAMSGIGREVVINYFLE